jgi:cell division control protein 6
MYMEFTFTGDPAAMMNRIVDDTRLEAIANQEELLRSVVNSQLNEFHNQ